MMRIACSSTSRIPSETANSIQVLMACQGLVDCGHEIKLWVPGMEPVDFDLIRDRYGLHCDAFPISMLKSAPRLKRLDFSLASIRAAQQWQADIIYTWTVQIAALAAQRGKPVVFEAHDLPVGTFGTHWFGMFVAAKAEKRVLFITEALRDKVLKSYPKLKRNECIIAPNGVNLRDYQNLPDLLSAKQSLGIAGKLMVSCSGHLYAGRGVDLFLELAAAFPDVLFWWFGGMPADVSAYRKKAQDIANVDFRGFIPKSQLPLMQAASDVLLMPYGKSIAGSSGGDSAAICSPMKMFEYMAAGRAILTSDLPVIHEVLDERKAFFCQPDDFHSWEEGLRLLLKDASLRDSLGNAAQTAVAAYTWQQREARLDIERSS